VSNYTVPLLPRIGVAREEIMTAFDEIMRRHTEDSR